MHYAHPQPTLPRPRTMLAPLVALVIGLAGATGGYALLDDDVSVLPAQVDVAESPIQPGEGGSVKNEASVAAAVGGAVAGPSTALKNEAATAAAIGNSADTSGQTKDEAATAAAIAPSSQDSLTTGEDGPRRIHPQGSGFAR